MAAACSSLWVIGIVIAILYVIFLEPLCWMFGATELTIDYALGYGRIISIGMIYNVFTIGSMSLVRADGKPGILPAVAKQPIRRTGREAVNLIRSNSARSLFVGC